LSTVTIASIVTRFLNRSMKDLFNRISMSCDPVVTAMYAIVPR
jgi:hypothetical protein